MARIAVAGGSGFVGRRLVAELIDRGHTVTVLTRRPAEHSGPGEAVFADVHESGGASSLTAALQGADLAYYLIHSLGSEGFEAEDAAAAEAFGQAAATRGVPRIVYLGGLGSDDEELSPHLRSRREVEGLLGSAGVPVTVLRAAVIVGHGGSSWELTRQLAGRLPALVAPPWAETKTQPIGIDDIVRYLADVGGDERAAGQTYEVGGPDQITYREMLQIAADVLNGRSMPVATLPMPAVLATNVSGWILSLISDVDAVTVRHLIESMSTEVLVTEHSIGAISPTPPIGYVEQVTRAFIERALATV